MLQSSCSNYLSTSMQTLGSVGALFYLSPKLTGLMVIVVPVIVGVGSLLGSGLRHLSRRAQAQSAKATAVADEAIGNVRTVKAFAMEDLEIRQVVLVFCRMSRIFSSL